MFMIFALIFVFYLCDAKEDGKAQCENGVALGRERIKGKETTVTEVGCTL